MKLTQRLNQLEAQHKTVAKVVRYFTGYPQVNRFYEVGSSPINYRNGLNNAPEAGTAYTSADIDNLKHQGQPVDVLEVRYIDLDATKQGGVI